MKKRGLIFSLALLSGAVGALGLAACETHQHTYSEEWKYDETYHWHAATCEHGEEVGDKGEHVFENGVCCDCGYMQPSEGLNMGWENDICAVLGIGSCTDTHIVIPSVYHGEPVTGIAHRAFAGCENLTSVTMPDSVTSIGDQAFEGCTGLTNIVIPDSVTSIGGWAFSDCNNLTSITIPDGVTAIVGVFAGCTGLTNIVIPDGVTTIEAAFVGCTGLTSITIPDGVTSMHYAFAECTGLTSITIPDSVTTIEEAFQGCTGLTSITIPDSVTSIDGAFYDCSNLTSVTIPDGVTSIGRGTFANCSSLTSVTIGNGVTSIGGQAFEGCTGLTNIVIPDSVTSIGGSAFRSCSGLTSITLPFVGVEKDGTKYTHFGCIFGAFRNSDNDDYVPESLKSVTITGGAIDAHAFAYCSNLTSITIGSGVTSIGSSAFYGCNGLMSITIPDSVTEICDGAFTRTILESITVNENNMVYTSQDGILYDKAKTQIIFIPSALKGGVTIPDSVTLIGDYAFSGRTGLTSIAIGNGVTSINQWAFCDCSSLTSVTLGSSVTSIDYSAFRGCSNLTSVTIGSSVTEIGDYAFYGCYNIANVYFKGDLSDYVRLGIGFHFNNYRLYLWDGTQYVEPTSASVSAESIGSIGGIISIEELTVLYSADYMGSTLFLENCPSLKKVNLEYFENEITVNVQEGTEVVYGYRLEKKNEGGFEYVVRSGNVTLLSYNGAADRVILPKQLEGVAVTAFGQMFKGNTTIKEVIIPEGYTEISAEAFYNCTALQLVYIPSTVNTVGENAFYNNNFPYLTSATSDALAEFAAASVGKGMYMPDTTVAAQWQGFRDKSYATHSECYFDDASATIYSIWGTEIHIERYCGLDTAVTVPATINGIAVAEIQARAFYNRTEIKSVILSEGVTGIYQNAFEGCSALESITLPNSLKTVATEAFADCVKLTSIRIPAKVYMIGREVFRGCTALTAITFETVNGWMYCAVNSDDSPNESSATAIGVNDPAANVAYLRDTYAEKAFVNMPLIEAEYGS